MKKQHPKNWVRHYRKKAGMTMDQLADLVGISKVMIGYIERSEKTMTMENARKIAAALDVPVMNLYEGPRDEIIDAIVAKAEQLAPKDRARIEALIDAFLETGKNDNAS